MHNIKTIKQIIDATGLIMRSTSLFYLSTFSSFTPAPFGDPSTNSTFPATGLPSEAARQPKG
jgi:hypothetical protein